MKRTVAFILAFGIALASPFAHADDQSCKLLRVFSTENIAAPRAVPRIAGSIGGQPIKFIIDTGAPFGALPRAYTAGLDMHTLRNAWVTDASGQKIVEYVEATNLLIGSTKLPDLEFMVGGGNDGSFGANVLGRFDVELDPVERTISLFRHLDCNHPVVHWPYTTMGVLPFRSGDTGHIIFNAKLDGKAIQGILDTGATQSAMSEDVARRRFDLDPATLEAAPTLTAIAGGAVVMKRHRFARLDLTDIGVTNPNIDIGGKDFTISRHGETIPIDLVLGMDIISALHLYIAYDRQEIYVSSEAGDIAAGRKPSGGLPAADPPAVVNANDLLVAAGNDLQAGDKAKAAAEYDQAVRLMPSSAQVLATRAAFFASQGDAARAAADFDQAVRVEPNSAGAYAARGFWNFGRGEIDAALADAEQAIRVGPNEGAGYALRGEIERRRRDWGHALADADMWIKLAPSEVRAVELRGAIQFEKGDDAAALDSYDRAVGMAPGAEGPLLARSATHRRLKHFDRALDDADDAVKLHPQSPLALNTRCWTKAVMGQTDSARKDCDAALALSPQFSAALDSRGLVNFKSGRLDAALADYNAALTLAPFSASSLYGRGTVKQKLGDAAGAAADIAAAKRLKPDIAESFGT